MVSRNEQSPDYKLGHFIWTMQYDLLHQFLQKQRTRRGEAQFKKWLIDARYENVDPLTIAMNTRNDRLIELLLKYGEYTREQLSRKLVQEICNMQPAVIRLLIRYGADVNYQIKISRMNMMFTALIRASLYDYCTDTVRVLLTNGADPNIRDHEGRTALMVASLKGNIDIVEILLQHRANPNDQSSEMITALMYACQKDENVRIVKLLVRHFADVYAVDNKSVTALMYASRYGSTQIVDYLLAFHQDINHQDVNGGTALMYACKYGNLDIVRLLLEHGADVNRRRPLWGITSLMEASTHNHSAIVELLLKYGANIGLRDWKGKTAFFKAIETASVDVMKLLLQNDPSIINHKIPGSNITPLMYAVEIASVEDDTREKRLKIIRFLLEHGSNVNDRDEMRRTALMIAADKKDVGAMRILMEKNADPNLKDRQHKTVLKRILSNDTAHDNMKHMILLLLSSPSLQYRIQEINPLVQSPSMPESVKSLFRDYDKRHFLSYWSGSLDRPLRKQQYTRTDEPPAKRLRVSRQSQTTQQKLKGVSEQFRKRSTIIPQFASYLVGNPQMDRRKEFDSILAHYKVPDTIRHEYHQRMKSMDLEERAPFIKNVIADIRFAYRHGLLNAWKTMPTHQTRREYVQRHRDLQKQFRRLLKNSVKSESQREEWERRFYLSDNRDQILAQLRTR